MCIANAADWPQMILLIYMVIFFLTSNLNAFKLPCTIQFSKPSPLIYIYIYFTHNSAHPFIGIASSCRRLSRNPGENF